MVTTPWQGYTAFPQTIDLPGAARKLLVTSILTVLVFLAAPPAHSSIRGQLPVARKNSASTFEPAWARVPLGEAEFGAISSNGRWVVTTEKGRRVRVSRLTGSGAAHTLQNPTDSYLHYARVSPDGSLVVAVGKRSAIVWGLPEARVIRTIEAKERDDVDGFLVTVSPDAALVAVAGPNGSVRVLDSRTGSEIAAHKGRPGSVFFTEDGARVVTHASALSDAKGDAPAIEVWNAKNGATAARFDLDIDAMDGESVCWGISPDGTKLAVANSEDGRLYLYDAGRGSKPRVVEAKFSRMTALSFSPQSRYVVTGSADGAEIREATSGQVIRVLHAPSSRVVHAAFSADGRWVATAGEDHAVRLWRADTGQLVRSCPVRAAGAGFRMVSLTPSGDAILGVGDEEETYVWLGPAKGTLVASKR